VQQTRAGLGNVLQYIKIFHKFQYLTCYTIPTIAIRLMPKQKYFFFCLLHRSQEALRNWVPNIEIAYKYVRIWNPKMNSDPKLNLVPSNQWQHYIYYKFEIGTPFYLIFFKYSFIWSIQIILSSQLQNKGSADMGQRQTMTGVTLMNSFAMSQ
jgi:hypothetical protein